MKVPKPVKEPSGQYYIRLRLGGESVAVRAHTKSACIHKAEQLKAEYRATHEVKRAKPLADELTLRDCIEQYIEIKKGKVSPATIRGYNVILRNRFPDYMDYTLNRINWQAAYDADASKVSAKTMQNSWGLVKVSTKHIARYTVPDIATVKVKPAERNFLMQEEIKILCNAVKGTDIEIPTLLCLASLRVSEAFALTWDKVDFRNKRILINRATVQGDEGYVDKDEMKTAASRRYIHLSEQLSAALSACKKKDGKVLTMMSNTFRKRLKRVCEQEGLPIVSPHGLRHSFATLCHSLNMPIKDTMALGGWSNYQTVMKIYTHLDKMQLAKSESALTRFFDEL